MKLENTRRYKREIFHRTIAKCEGFFINNIASVNFIPSVCLLICLYDVNLYNLFNFIYVMSFPVSPSPTNSDGQHLRRFRRLHIDGVVDNIYICQRFPVFQEFKFLRCFDSKFRRYCSFRTGLQNGGSRPQLTSINIIVGSRNIMPCYVTVRINVICAY